MIQCFLGYGCKQSSCGYEQRSETQLYHDLFGISTDLNLFSAGTRFIVTPLVNSEGVCVPGEGDGDAHGRSEACEAPALTAHRLQTGVCGGEAAHLGDQRQRDLLTLLKASQQQQKILLLIDQSLPEALGAQVLPIQPLWTQKNFFLMVKLNFNV